MARRTLIALVVVLLLASRDANAQWLGSVTGGVNVGGAAEKLYPHASLAFGRWTDKLALEIDAAIIPLLFESEPGDEIEMVVAIVPTVIVPIRPLTNAVTPFVSGGIGFMSYSLTNSVDEFEDGRRHAAISAGGGFLKSMTDAVSLRVGANYTRALADVNPPAGFRFGNAALDFWTVGAGVAIRF